MNHKSLMRGENGSSKETFVCVRQARGKGKEEGAGEEEIVNRGSGEIIGIEVAQEHRKKTRSLGEG